MENKQNIFRYIISISVYISEMGYDDYLNYLHYEMNKLFSAREKQCITTKIAV